MLSLVMSITVSDPLVHRIGGAGHDRTLRRSVVGCLLLMALCSTVAAAPNATSTPKVFVYGEIYDDGAEQLETEPRALSTSNLVAHLAWLREHDYKVISAADMGRRLGRLSDHDVLLVFSGDVRKFYDIVYPLLEIFDIAAVLTLTQRSVEGAVEWPSLLKEMHTSGRLQFALTLDQEASRLTSAGELSLYLAKVRQAMAAKVGVAPMLLVYRGSPYQAIAHEAALSAGMLFVVAESIDRFVHPLVLPAHAVIGNPGADFPARVLNQRRWLYPPLRGLRLQPGAIFDAQGALNEQTLAELTQRVTGIDPNVVFVPGFLTDGGHRQARRLLFPNRVTGMGGDALVRVARALSAPVYAWMPGTIAAQDIERVVPIFEDLAANAPIDGVLLDPRFCLGACPADPGPPNRQAIARIRAAIHRWRPAAELVWAVPEDQLERGDFHLEAALADRFLVTRDISAHACAEDIKTYTWTRAAQTGGLDHTIFELAWRGDTVPEWTLFDCIDRLRIIGVRHYGFLIPSLSATGLHSLYTRISINRFPYVRNDL